MFPEPQGPIGDKSDDMPALVLYCPKRASIVVQRLDNRFVAITLASPAPQNQSVWPLPPPQGDGLDGSLQATAMVGTDMPESVALVRSIIKAMMVAAGVSNHAATFADLASMVLESTNPLASCESGGGAQNGTQEAP